MTAQHELEQVVREEWGRLIAVLLARLSRLDLVKDALADAIEAAARTWAHAGVPNNPAGWLHRTAQRRVLDRLRAEAMASRKHVLIATDLDRAPTAAMADPGGLVEDDVLRLVLMCTHPALAPEAASALALRLVLGVSTHDVARLFLVPETTMAARITRAKKKIVTAGIPFAVPDAAALPERLSSIAVTAYLAFTAGYAPGSGPDPVRVDLAGEAVRLTRTVHRLRPDDPTLSALLALMLLQHSRRDARTDSTGALVLLPDQDRSLWRRDEIDEALGLLTSAPLQQALSAQAAAYLLQALIAREHAVAAEADQTRWDRIVEHYDALLKVEANPGARLARAVAVAEAEGPEAGLAALEGVDLPGNHRLAAVRAELLARSGDRAGSLESFDEAIELCRNDAERRHLEGRREAMAAS